MTRNDIRRAYARYLHIRDTSTTNYANNSHTNNSYVNYHRFIYLNTIK